MKYVRVTLEVEEPLLGGGDQNHQVWEACKRVLEQVENGVEAHIRKTEVVATKTFYPYE